MAIKIIKEPDIYMTQAEHDKLHRAWEQSCRYTTEPPTFEDFVASQMARSGVCSCPSNGVSSACRMHGERPSLETGAGTPGFTPETPEQERSMRRDRYPPRQPEDT